MARVYGRGRRKGEGICDIPPEIQVFTKSYALDSLIDRAGHIREINTSNFLHPQVVANDIETLLAE